jgi:transcriptional regulator with XRE-family HTH domain
MKSLSPKEVKNAEREVLQRVMPLAYKAGLEDEHIEELAEIIERSATCIYRWESGDRAPSFEDMDRIAGALRVPLSWLFTSEITEAGQGLTEEGALDLIEQGLGFLRSKKAATPKDAGFRTTQPDRVGQWAKNPPDEPSATGNP